MESKVVVHSGTCLRQNMLQHKKTTLCWCWVLLNSSSCLLSTLSYLTSASCFYWRHDTALMAPPPSDSLLKWFHALPRQWFGSEVRPRLRPARPTCLQRHLPLLFVFSFWSAHLHCHVTPAVKYNLSTALVHVPLTYSMVPPCQLDLRLGSLHRGPEPCSICIYYQVFSYAKYNPFIVL